MQISETNPKAEAKEADPKAETKEADTKAETKEANPKAKPNETKSKSTAGSKTNAKEEYSQEMKFVLNDVIIILRTQ